jgi:hypothetical protein
MQVIPTVLALVAVAMLLLALLMMNRGQFMLAGLSFLSASLVIYFRESRL